MKGKILENKNTRPSYKEDNMDYDMAFSKSFREKVFCSELYKLKKKNYVQTFFREYLCIFPTNTHLAI